ncbi:MAG: type II toxin-antitoxin system VapC family toxin [Chloroflexi bacterium]|nr:type II toxin-antitoxin system VapC family toxin [Chloroflexota bacterium]
MFLFDTDTLSQIIKREPSSSLLNRMAAVPRDEQFTTSITVGEMVYGAERSSRRDYLLRQFESQLWPALRILPFDRAAAEAYGSLRAELERAGTPLSEPDTRIAAIALTHNLTLVTGNVRHFSRVAGLSVENWI